MLLKERRRAGEERRLREALENGVALLDLAALADEDPEDGATPATGDAPLPEEAPEEGAPAAAARAKRARRPGAPAPAPALEPTTTFADVGGELDTVEAL